MKPKITFRVAPWRTMQTPTQRDKDKLLERICDTRTRKSRERLQQGQNRLRANPA